jgi:RNA polymerase sigma-70 factor (sigma-E family)
MGQGGVRQRSRTALNARERDESYAAFVAARQTQLRRIAYALCGDWSRAEDVLQTALVKLYVAWPRLHRDGREEAYVRQIIVRATIDEHRRPWHRERATGEVPDAAASTGTSVEDRDELISALQLLPTMQRSAVVMRHWLGLSTRETAIELGISEGTVKSHTSRGLARLSDLLGEPAEP